MFISPALVKVQRVVLMLQVISGVPSGQDAWCEKPLGINPELGEESRIVEDVLFKFNGVSNLCELEIYSKTLSESRRDLHA